MNRSGNRLTAAITLALSVTVAVTGGPAANAAPAPIRIAGTGGDGVLMHEAPTVGSTRTGWLAEGASPDYTCFTYGDRVGSVNVWFSVTNAGGATGYYPSYYDNSSYSSEANLTDKYGIPKCGSAPTPAPASATPPATTPAPRTPTAGFFSPFNRGERGDDGRVEDLRDHSVRTVHPVNWYACDARSDRPYNAAVGLLPSGQFYDRIGGWSLGRFGPVELLQGMARRNDTAARKRLTYIIQIDPGPYSDLSDCDQRLGAGKTYADWLVENSNARLVVLSGKMSQKDKSKGIQEIYFNPIRTRAPGTNIRSRVLTCNYPLDHYTIYHAGQYWIKNKVPMNSCPVLNFEGRRWAATATWHP